MPSQYKSNLLTGVIATHFAIMMTLLDKSADYRWEGRYYGIENTVLYLVFFFFDIPVFLLLLSMRHRPYLEGGARTVGLFWVLQMIFVLLPTGGIGPGFFIASILQIILLVWPKRYFPTTEDETQIEEAAGETTRVKCTHCGAIYVYNSDTIVNGEVACQNCGMSTKA